LKAKNRPVVRGVLEALYVATCFLAYYSGIYSLSSFLQRKKPVVLLYHSVNRKNCRDVYPDNIVDVRDFDKQMSFLSSKKNCVTLDYLVSYLEGSSKASPNQVAVTFDDGYHDFFTNAYPILKKYNIPCTVFLITGLLDENIIKWEDRLTRIVSNTIGPALSFKLDGTDRTYDLSTATARLCCLRSLNDLFLDIDPQRRIRILSELEFQLGTPPPPAEPLYLSWKEVKELHDDGLVSFGSHTHDHVDMCVMSEHDIEREVEQPREEIEAKLNSSCTLFSYPYGKRRHISERVKDLLDAHGYRLAVTTVPGRISENSDPMELKRIVALDGQMLKFKCAMVGLTPQTS